jgi:hypothetical protein
LQAGGVELKRRDRTEREIVALDQLLPRVHQELDALTGGIHQTLKPEELSAV